MKIRSVSVVDPRVRAVLDRMYELDHRQAGSLIAHFVPRLLWNRFVRGRGNVFDGAFLRDKLVALPEDKATFCYLQCVALNARRVVEVGTSFGVSTLFLASAVRRNCADGGVGCVIGTEKEPSKASQARANWAEAGLDHVIELREGDALQTLKDCGGPVDFVLIDTWMPLARPALDLLVPQLRRGAAVVCDNVTAFAREYSDYLQRVRDPALGFRSTTLPYKGGLEFSVWDP